MARKTSPTLKIRVPASTSNLGPGFDGLGMALNLFNDFLVKPKKTGQNRIVGRGTCEGLRGGRNIFFDSMRRVSAMAGRACPKVDVEVKGGVPVARGLGSSATAIVAGALAANVLLGSPFGPEELMLPMLKVEGHPDNLAPALFGSLTASAVTPSQVLVHRYSPHRDWRVALLIPNYELSTAKARQAIPKKVPHRDAVFNLTRVPLIIDALIAGDGDELRMLVDDRLHEPYRKKLIKRYEQIRKAALDAGASAVYLSGAGPTMAALCLGERRAGRVARRMARAFTSRETEARSSVYRPRSRGATLQLL